MNKFLQFFIHFAKWLLSSIFFCISVGVLTYLWWILFGRWYLHLPHPVGGDYYTGLTYATQFAQHLPIPSAGWLSFWNSGVPIVGGYQWLTFYLMAPLFRFFDPATSLDYFSIFTILLFILSAHLLFWQITKNHILALVLTLVILTSQATYFQLLAGGLITGSSMQFYLPLALFFLFRYFESIRRVRSLILSATICGLALVHHSAMGLLFVVIPVTTMLIIHLLFYISSRRRQLLNLGAYIFFILTVGAFGLIPMITQMSFTEIASACDNPQCWGIYPYHITLWLGWLPVEITLATFLVSMLFVITRKILHKHTNLKPLIPTVFGLIVILAYPFASYFHLINHLANSIFPRRMFWAILVLLLVYVAHSFSLLSKQYRYANLIGGLILAMTILFFIPIRLDQSHQILLTNKLISDILPNADPSYSYKWLIPKYFDPAYSNYKLPDWLTPDHPEYRLDSPNALVTHWWNLESKIPVTRGYTSGFNLTQSDWAYYLQTSLSKESNQNVPDKLIENRAFFLFDAYGIGYTLNDLYHPLLQKEDLYENTGRIGKLKSEFTTPLVETTTAPAVLFVGDDAGYGTFIRSISLINYNSRHLIPVKGPLRLSSLTEQELNRFPALFLYRFSGNVSKLESYVANGGNVFVDFGSLGELPKLSDAKFFPATKINSRESATWEAKITNTNTLTENIDPLQFGKFTYQGKPWKYFSFPISGLKNNAKILLTQKGEPTLLSYAFGRGKMIVSGINFPFHIVESVSEPEAHLYASLLNYLVGIEKHEPVEAKVDRINPETVSITGRNFTGIYFKENYHSGWTANSEGKSLQIFPAGLNFMYIPISNVNSDTIELKFRGTLYTWILLILTMIGFTLVVIIIIAPRLVSRILNFLSLPLIRFIEKRSSTLRKDEHNEY